MNGPPKQRTERHRLPETLYASKLCKGIYMTAFEYELMKAGGQVTAVPASRHLVLLAVCLFAYAAPANAEQGVTFSEVSKGRTCKAMDFDPKQVNCRFVLPDLVFEIAGIGAPDASISIDTANSKGHYYVKMPLAFAPCIVVVPGDASPDRFLDRAAVSPRTGKVYVSPEECKAAR